MTPRPQLMLTKTTTLDCDLPSCSRMSVTVLDIGLLIHMYGMAASTNETGKAPQRHFVHLFFCLSRMAEIGIVFICTQAAQYFHDEGATLQRKVRGFLRAAAWFLS